MKRNIQFFLSWYVMTTWCSSMSLLVGLGQCTTQGLCAILSCGEQPHINFLVILIYWGMEGIHC